MIVKVKLMDNTCKYFYLMDVWNFFFSGRIQRLSNSAMLTQGS